MFIGFVGLLTLLFIALKLMGYIDWSWLWVTSPLWIEISLIIGLVVIAENIDNWFARLERWFRKQQAKNSK